MFDNAPHFKTQTSELYKISEVCHWSLYAVTVPPLKSPKNILTNNPLQIPP